MGTMKFLIFLFLEIIWGFTYDGQIELSAKLFDFKRTLKKETFEVQKSWCEGEGGFLPNPTTKEDNDKLAALGNTWIDPNYANAMDPPTFADFVSGGINEKVLFFQKTGDNLGGRWTSTIDSESAT